MTVKRSMSVHPAPINTDGTDRPHAPPGNDPRWERKDADGNWHYRAKWLGPWGYVISRVTNSTEYRPGWLLTKAKIDALIENGWTVSILSGV